MPAERRATKKPRRRLELSDLVEILKVQHATIEDLSLRLGAVHDVLSEEPNFAAKYEKAKKYRQSNRVMPSTVPVYDALARLSKVD
jgi:hypothetical protein